MSWSGPCRSIWQSARPRMPVHTVGVSSDHMPVSETITASAGEPVGVRLDQGAEVRGAGLLLALDQQLEVDGGGGTAGGGEVGPHAEGVEEDLPLVVGGAARVQAAVADPPARTARCASRPRGRRAARRGGRRRARWARPGRRRATRRRPRARRRSPRPRRRGSRSPVSLAASHSALRRTSSACAGSADTDGMRSHSARSSRKAARWSSMLRPDGVVRSGMLLLMTGSLSVIRGSIRIGGGRPGAISAAQPGRPSRSLLHGRRSGLRCVFVPVDRLVLVGGAGAGTSRPHRLRRGAAVRARHGPGALPGAPARRCARRGTRRPRRRAARPAARPRRGGRRRAGAGRRAVPAAGLPVDDLVRRGAVRGGLAVDGVDAAADDPSGEFELERPSTRYGVRWAYGVRSNASLSAASSRSSAISAGSDPASSPPGSSSGPSIGSVSSSNRDSTQAWKRVPRRAAAGCGGRGMGRASSRAKPSGSAASRSSWEAEREAGSGTSRDGRAGAPQLARRALPGRGPRRRSSRASSGRQPVPDADGACASARGSAPSALSCVPASSSRRLPAVAVRTPASSRLQHRLGSRAPVRQRVGVQRQRPGPLLGGGAAQRRVLRALLRARPPSARPHRAPGRLAVRAQRFAGRPTGRAASSGSGPTSGPSRAVAERGRVKVT